MLRKIGLLKLCLSCDKTDTNSYSRRFLYYVYIEKDVYIKRYQFSCSLRFHKHDFRHNRQSATTRRNNASDFIFIHGNVKKFSTMNMFSRIFFTVLRKSPNFIKILVWLSQWNQNIRHSDRIFMTSVMTDISRIN